MSALSPTLDIETPRRAMADTTRCQVESLLDDDTLAAARAAIDTVPRWTLVTKLNGRHLDLDSAAMGQQSPAQKAEFQRHVDAEARRGFGYLYDTYSIYDKWHRGELRREVPALCDLFELINSDRFLDPMRTILDAPDIAFADAQLTRYTRGHFLTTHDDGVAGKNRVAAYVLTLSDGWKKGWGGLLEFYGPGGSVETAFVPRGNTLSMFKVPQPHAVTRVGDKVRAARVSITGWLRTGTDPGPGGS